MKYLIKGAGKLLFFVCMVLLIYSCLSDTDDIVPDGSKPEFVLTYDFSSGKGDWQTGFSEYPLSAADTLQIEAEMVSSIGALGGDSLLRLSAIDPVADIFPFIKLKVTGLTPSTEFNVLVETEFAAVNLDPIGTTYEGDQEVHLKAGVFENEPLLIPANDSIDVGYSYEVLDIDKGNGVDVGNDMALLGTVVMPSPNVFSQLIRGINTGSQLSGTSDADGNMWLLIGTDSETQMHQAFYYSRVAVLYEEKL